MTQDEISLAASREDTPTELTQDRLLDYAQKLESSTSNERLNASLEKSGLLDAGGATAGGQGVAKRISLASRWKNDQVRPAWELYLKMLRRDVWLSSVSIIVYISLIAVLTALVVLIAYQIVNREFSYRQLAGLPLPLIIRLLFRANVHERDNYRKMRADLSNALKLLMKN